MPGRAISNKKQRLWNAFNEARATIKAEAYKLFKEYENYCLSFSEPRSADTDLLSSRDSFRSLSAMVYSQFQAMMDFGPTIACRRGKMQLNCTFVCFSVVSLGIEHCVTPSVIVKHDNEMRIVSNPSFQYVTLQDRVRGIGIIYVLAAS